MTRRLRTELLCWILLPLAAVAAFNVWLTHRSAMAFANLVTDRTLLASARVIAEQVKEVDGSVQALIPPSAIEMFANPDRDRVIYRVLAPSGEMIAGYPDVALAPTAPNDSRPVFFDAMFRTQPVRAVAVAQPVVSKVAGGDATIIVGETLRGRDRLVSTLWSAALRDQIVLIVFTGFLAILAFRKGFAPLDRLGRDLRSRSPQSLEPLPEAALHLELRPLVQALNEALGRVRAYIDLQRRFVANASHQLRTPLALLKTQAVYAMRETDIREKDSALAAIDRGIDGQSRLVNQLLTLARAETGEAIRRERIDLVETVQTALGRLSQLAFAKQIDLSFDCDAPDIPHDGHAGLLQELVANLLENAIAHTPPGGRIAVRMESGEAGVLLRFEDSGRGIPGADRERVLRRFERGPGAAEGGTGLGLAIVAEIAAAHKAEMSLGDAAAGGLRVDIRFPGTT